MIALAKYSSSVIEQGKRILKSIGIGGSVMTTKECAPFGIDSQPPEGYTAIYANTTNNSEEVIIGYINRNQISQAGECRLYAVGVGNTVISEIYLKNNGQILMNNGNKSSVRFQDLKTAIDQQNTLINTQFQIISGLFSGLGLTYVPGTITTNLTNSESPNIKIP